MFFLTIVALLALMAVWEYASPGGNPRVGILRFETTRGTVSSSRCSAAHSFISHGWGWSGASLWWALASVCGLRHRRIQLGLGQAEVDGRGATGPLSNRNRKTLREDTMRKQFTDDDGRIMLLAFTGSAFAGMDEAKTFLDKEIGDMSTL